MDIEVLVFDVLGTLVDEPAGIRAGIRKFAPSLAAAEVEELLSVWQKHVEQEQVRIVAGERPYVASDVIDREAAQAVADAAGTGDAAELALAARRLPPWPDTVDGLARLGERFPLAGLSNASRTVLLDLCANAGLRWHTVLSAEDARTYKPAPDVYRLAIDVAGRAPERLLMVAAHAWDLRGAREAGFRTAYVSRPVGDPPGPADRFDFHACGLADLADQLEHGRD
ncbi:haloacid dehalogenase type II [Amycolatopsis rubida]|uniref:Haloacid dehalogenase type II n=1 Tax=Amycolatopsis rubida TaxID=112413 RepID=A0ABX0BTD5_9PSEU|nr:MULTISPECIES: haloacid dehalogenase type II [Amycolatopsis]MYW93649.1 haloacid dehalogenase type II [Amycolatopsis rubida]NEC58636.1 haloacid dehalogenase type II [Amycolatopsis rubida]OAP21446.1 (S)-2-haloacid dehalogenase [Amycolatopsis sp. M39]